MLTLFAPTYLSISRNRLGGVRFSNLFGNDLLWNDLPYSKGCMMFGCLEPSKIMFDILIFLYVQRRLTQFLKVLSYEILVFLTNFISFGKTR